MKRNDFESLAIKLSLSAAGQQKLLDLLDALNSGFCSAEDMWLQLPCYQGSIVSPHAINVEVEGYHIKSIAFAEVYDCDNHIYLPKLKFFINEHEDGSVKIEI